MATDTARQAEIQVKQTKIINDDKNVCSIQASGIQRRGQSGQQRGSQGITSKGYYGNSNNKNKESKCKYCGHGPHERTEGILQMSVIRKMQIGTNRNLKMYMQWK